MARFFFDVRDSLMFCDIEGYDLPDVDTARREAIRYAGRLIMDVGDVYLDRAEFSMSVRDDAGVVVFNLHFGCANTQAVQVAA